MTIHCPRHTATGIVKNGFAKGCQRFKCKHSNYQFTKCSQERGKPLWIKLEAVLTYLSGMSINAAAKILGISAQPVLNWVKEFDESNYDKLVQSLP